MDLVPNMLSCKRVLKDAFMRRSLHRTSFLAADGKWRWNCHTVLTWGSCKWWNIQVRIFCLFFKQKSSFMFFGTKCLRCLLAWVTVGKATPPSVRISTPNTYLVVKRVALSFLVGCTHLYPSINQQVTISSYTIRWFPRPTLIPTIVGWSHRTTIDYNWLLLWVNHWYLMLAVLMLVMGTWCQYLLLVNINIYTPVFCCWYYCSMIYWWLLVVAWLVLRGYPVGYYLDGLIFIRGYPVGY